jgi:dCTP deaminase
VKEKTELMALSDKNILKHMELGNIIIDPFNPKDLCTSSYDVRLGEWFYREQGLEKYFDKHARAAIFNPYNQSDVERIWGEPQQAETFADQLDTMFGWEKRISLNATSNEYDIAEENIALDEKIIFIEPGETILGHTVEFIGGLNCVTTSMQARSSQGRSFIGVCKCAGWGDVGYFNRWTMEITNFSRYYTIPLVVGRRYAQIVFPETGEILEKGYGETGKYQTGSSIEEIKASWKPEMMLPKLYIDRDIRK